MSEIPAREIALHILKAVESEGAYANLALNRALEKHQPGKLDRAFATELSYGTLRVLNTLDWIISRFLHKPLADQSVWIRSILRMGVYQIFYMDKVPAPAACNEAVELAKKYGTPGTARFVNGVLRNVVRRKDEIVFPSADEDLVSHIALRYSHPTWLVERWLDEFGLEETTALCKANNATPPNTIRTNTLRTSRENLITTLEQEGLNVRTTRYAPEGLEISGFLSLRTLPSFGAGVFQIQDESSMLAGHAVSPTAGARVIDVCSAPGGKATHLAQLMGDDGEIRALDIHPHKLDFIRENCERLGIRCVDVMCRDSRNLPGDMGEWADFVLVDAPCSGLGVLCRRPDARWRKEPAQIEALAGLQAEIMDAAARCVRPGGILVYSTCTITRGENEGQIERFLNNHPEFELDDLKPLLPATLGETELSRGYIQLLPHVHGTDGFFIARLRRREGNQ